MTDVRKHFITIECYRSKGEKGKIVLLSLLSIHVITDIDCEAKEVLS